MRVFMLGWEFPPVISGGLGTACLGLTRALVQKGVDVTFVLPRSPEEPPEGSMEVIGLQSGPPPVGYETDDERSNDAVEGEAGASEAPSPAHPSPPAPSATGSHSHSPPQQPSGGWPPPGQVGPHQGGLHAGEHHRGVAHQGGSQAGGPYQGIPAAVDPVFSAVDFIQIDAWLWPYRRPDGIPTEPVYGDAPPPPPPAEHPAPPRVIPPFAVATPETPLPAPPPPAPPAHRPAPPPGPPRASSELFKEVERYAHLAMQSAAGKTFDVIHAHDWMTFPAAEAIADMTGRPFVAHVHSTEFDRSGHRIEQRIYDIERAGLERAEAVIAVSHMTREILMSRYGVPAEKIVVVYNAVEANGRSSGSPPPAIKRDEKIVLFLGRITMQKGPEYFLAAARKVLQVYPRVRFVMAGAGDAVRRTMQLAEEMGIADSVVFTGFLQGADVERIFRSADLYVMPSVSDPFGIASLEAISYDVPVLLSKQSGVAEVLRHVLKVDFWDIDEMANKIVAVLRHPPLHATLKKQASYEVRRLSWSDSANRCTDVYRAALQGKIDPQKPVDQ